MSWGYFIGGIMKIKRKILTICLLGSLSFSLYPITSGGNEPRGIFNARNIFYGTGILFGAFCTYFLYKYFTSSALIEEPREDGDALQEACRANDLERVKAFLADVEDINAVKFDSRQFKNCPPIYFACESDNLDILKWMVEEKGADVNTVCEIDIHCIGSCTFGECGCICGNKIIGKKKVAPLYSVVGSTKSRRDKIAMVDYLLSKDTRVDERYYYNDIHHKREDRQGKTPLYSACTYGYLDIVKRLADKGADVNSDNAHINVHRKVISEKPIHAAARNGSGIATGGSGKEVVKELLSRGVDIESKNSIGETPLHVAVTCAYGIGGRNTDMVDFLLENGANINAGDNGGNTAIHKVIRSHAGACLFWARALIEKGAHVNARNLAGETPLMLACKRGHLRLVTYLLSVGATLNARSVTGKTALMFACEGNLEIRGMSIREMRTRRELVAYLLSVNADMSITDNEGKNAFYFAANSSGIVHVLEVGSSIKNLLEGNQSEKIIAKLRLEAKLFNSNVAPAIRKELLPKLLEVHRKNLLSEQELKKCFDKVAFDKQFLEEERFKGVLEFAKQKKIADVNGKVLFVKNEKGG